MAEYYCDICGAGPFPSLFTLGQHKLEAHPPALGEFIFVAYTPLTDLREIFVVGTAWPGLVRKIKTGESVYVHYAVKNRGDEAGKGTITVKDLGTGETLTTWSTPELSRGERFRTTGSGAYVGVMPAKDWRLEFKVVP